MDKQTALIVVEAFAYLVAASQVFLVVLLVSVVTKVKSITNFFSQNALSFAFLVALTAMVGSLFFSEFAHFTPCKLCWYQRILMYPQVILLGIAAVKNDFAIKRYILPLSVIGLFIAIYHYALQMSPIPLPCSDEVANCALKQIGYFGYITIPLMAATAFALIITFMLLLKKGREKK